MASALGFCPTLLAVQHSLLVAGGTRQSSRLSWRGPAAAAAAARPGRAPRPPALRCPGGAALRKAAIWRVSAAQPGGTGSECPGGAAPPPPPNQQAADQAHFQRMEREKARERLDLRLAGLVLLGCAVGKFYFTSVINWPVVLAAVFALFIAPTTF